jgi:hypothetical protein
MPPSLLKKKYKKKKKKKYAGVAEPRAGNLTRDT